MEAGEKVCADRKLQKDGIGSLLNLEAVAFIYPFVATEDSQSFLQLRLDEGV